MNSENTVSKIFNGIAMTEFVLGGLVSFICLLEEPVVGIIIAVSVFISGMMFMGIAEIIKLLQIIADKAVSQPKVFSTEASIIEDIESELPVL
ncbi:MAG: hypothetical protein IJD81_08600 [Oscillospiraceae bacterium]|nr:hypothetical protein [Oscillospiraceae bacterium]